MAYLQILKPGIQTTVQDAGRPQHQRDGFPESGSIDQGAARVANLLVGNAEQAAVLEFSLLGPTIEFSAPTFIALTGAEFATDLNGEPLAANRCWQVQAGDVLTIGNATKGRVGYLAVAGGIQTQPVLGSRSTTMRLHLGGLNGQALAAGDLLPVKRQAVLPSYFHRHLPAERLPEQATPAEIRLLKGPQWDWFDKATQTALVDSEYEISNQADRMGYRLTGPKLTVPERSLLSTATVRGALQVPANGQPIVLLADRQTTGGYPIIAVVATVDLGYFAQCQPGQKVRFKLIDLPTAQTLLADVRQPLDELEQTVITGKYKPPYGISRVASQRIARLFED
ncbi:5-oxoprolinase subunit C family protein [Limosilactobacillus ingluviei]